jgi:thiamine pyrophosphate-dependent acetolactate synthase large subunit-like protein
MLGSMGLAIPIAVGVAITQPQRRVIALEGDGSILMQLGVFATIASRKPRNLGIVIMDNGCYQITGSQPTPTADVTDIAAVARGCGLERVASVASLHEFGDALETMLAGKGPWVIVAKIDASAPRGVTERDPIRIRQRFMDAMAA